MMKRLSGLLIRKNQTEARAEDELEQMLCSAEDFHHTAKEAEHDTDTAIVRGANPSVANVAKNVCTHDTVVLDESILHVVCYVNLQH